MARAPVPDRRAVVFTCPQCGRKVASWSAERRDGIWRQALAELRLARNVARAGENRYVVSCPGKVCTAARRSWPLRGDTIVRVIRERGRPTPTKVPLDEVGI